MAIVLSRVLLGSNIVARGQKVAVFGLSKRTQNTRVGTNAAGAESEMKQVLIRNPEILYGFLSSQQPDNKREMNV